MCGFGVISNASWRNADDDECGVSEQGHNVFNRQTKDEVGARYLLVGPILHEAAVIELKLCLLLFLYTTQVEHFINILQLRLYFCQILL